MLVLYILLPLLIVYGGYRVAVEILVDRADARAARDPETGVVEGMEARTLGPAHSAGLVLMVHGFVGGPNNFADLPERLAARGWKVRLMRLPGHGTSPRDYARTSPDELVTAVRGELAHWKGGRRNVVLVGHSMGAALTTIVAADGGVDKLVLGAPYFGVTHHRWYGLRPETWTRVLRPVLPWVWKGKTFMQVNRPEAKDEIITYAWVPTRGLLTLGEIGRRARDPELLARVKAPVLLVHSRADQAASPEKAEEALAAMGSEVKETLWLTRSNHHVYYDWEQEEVMEAIVAFIGPAPRRGGTRVPGLPERKRKYDPTM